VKLPARGEVFAAVNGRRAVGWGVNARRGYADDRGVNARRGYADDRGVIFVTQHSYRPALCLHRCVTKWSCGGGAARNARGGNSWAVRPAQAAWSYFRFLPLFASASLPLPSALPVTGRARTASPLRWGGMFVAVSFQVQADGRVEGETGRALQEVTAAALLPFPSVDAAGAASSAPVQEGVGPFPCLSTSFRLFGWPAGRRPHGVRRGELPFPATSHERMAGGAPAPWEDGVSCCRFFLRSEMHGGGGRHMWRPYGGSKPFVSVALHVAHEGGYAVVKVRGGGGGPIGGRVAHGEAGLRPVISRHFPSFPRISRHEFLGCVIGMGR